MPTRKLLVLYGVILVVVSLPFTVIHLLASPDDALISPIQRVVAALANFFGPWGVALVRLADFPNAGLRSFSWVLAGALTLLAAAVIGLPLWMKRRPVQYACLVSWIVFLVVWFGTGLRQIADGLL